MLRYGFTCTLCGFGSISTCTVKVTDTSSGTPSTPTGSVTFSQSSPATGTFAPPNAQCTLSQQSIGTATCTVTFASGAGQVGSVTISASYPGDPTHLSSSGSAAVTVLKANPTMTTAFTPLSPQAGQSVTDTATISGGSLPTGTITFYEGFTSSSCTTGGTQVGSPVPVSGGGATSASLNLNAGTYYWDAMYSGDGNNNGATSPCETLTVAKATPSISTTLSAPSISAGGSTYDTATLSGDSGSNTKGTVSYYYFTSSSCSGSGTLVSTVTVANGNVPNSAPQTFSSAGSYRWDAV